MRPFWVDMFKIKSYEVDFNKKLKLSSLFNYLQEVAGNHANNLSVGYDDLKKQNLFWVLSRIKVIMYKYPTWNEIIRIETWPKGINKLFAIRDFKITDENYETLANVTSYWLLVDSNNMRPRKIESLQINFPTSFDNHAINQELDKIENNSVFENIYNKNISYSEIDVNNHVNNAVYVDWVMNAFNFDHYKEKELKSIQLNFLSEAKIGEEIFINKSNNKNDPNTFYIDGIEKKSDKKIIQALTEWKDIK